METHGRQFGRLQYPLERPADIPLIQRCADCGREDEPGLGPARSGEEAVLVLGGLVTLEGGHGRALLGHPDAAEPVEPLSVFFLIRRRKSPSEAVGLAPSTLPQFHESSTRRSCIGDAARRAVTRVAVGAGRGMDANSLASHYGVLGRALSCFFCSSCFCFVTCCCLLFSLSFLPPLSPMPAPFQPL